MTQTKRSPAYMKRLAEATHVSVRLPDNLRPPVSSTDERQNERFEEYWANLCWHWNKTFPIVLDFEDRVWAKCPCANPVVYNIEQISHSKDVDDLHGYGVFSLPADWCTYLKKEDILTRMESTMGERPDDMKRLYKATHVRITVPEDLILELRGTSDNISYYWSKTTPIILDAGAHVWVKEDKDSFPFPGVAQIEYDGDKCDFHGECLFRIPIEWCTFLTKDEVMEEIHGGD